MRKLTQFFTKKNNFLTDLGQTFALIHPVKITYEIPPNTSIHEIINDAVAPLDVMCEGVENKQIYFRKGPHNKWPIRMLGDKIVEVLYKLAEADEEIKTALKDIQLVTII